MKQLRSQAPASGRQMNLLFDISRLGGMNAPERGKAVSALAQILLQAAGVRVEELADDHADLIPASVLERKAVVYVRQSTQSEVMTNLEGQRRQYDLVEVAREMNVESYRRRAAEQRRKGAGRPPTYATIKSTDESSLRDNQPAT